MTSQKSFQLVHESKFNCNRIQSDNSWERAVTQVEESSSDLMMEPEFVLDELVCLCSKQSAC